MNVNTLLTLISSIFSNLDILANLFDDATPADHEVISDAVEALPPALVALAGCDLRGHLGLVDRITTEVGRVAVHLRDELILTQVLDLYTAALAVATASGDVDEIEYTTCCVARTERKIAEQISTFQGV